MNRRLSGFSGTEEQDALLRSFRISIHGRRVQRVHCPGRQGSVRDAVPVLLAGRRRASFLQIGGNAGTHDDVGRGRRRRVYDGEVSYSPSHTEMDRFFRQVESWMEEQLATAPAGMSNGWFTSDLGFYDVQQNLSESTVSAIALAMAIALAVLISVSFPSFPQQRRPRLGGRPRPPRLEAQHIRVRVRLDRRRSLRRLATLRRLKSVLRTSTSVSPSPCSITQSRENLRWPKRPQQDLAQERPCPSVDEPAAGGKLPGSRQGSEDSAPCQLVK